MDEAERVLGEGSELSPYSLSARRRQMRTELASARSRCRELLHHLHFRERAARAAAADRRQRAEAAHAS